MPQRHDLLALAAAQPARYPCLLQSAATGGGGTSSWDVLPAFPQDSLTLTATGRVTDAQGADLGDDFLGLLDYQWRTLRCVRGEEAEVLPFRGGWALFLAYELAASVEPVLQLPAAPDPSLPRAMALRCPVGVLVDHSRGRTLLVAEPEYAGLLALVEADLAAAQAPTPRPLALDAIDEDAAQDFLDGVGRIHDYLRAGDIFQVNLSREWRASLAESVPSAQLYANLRAANPAPFAGLFQGPDWAVISSSPERLVQVQGDRVQTRPIAGTRPRFPGDDDAARIRELVGHPKERAEHVMLIDLERNDLGRVAQPGSVVVDELMSVETYAHVHHIVSNVRAILRRDVTPGEVIRAVFPGGTITGCPKIRCMQIIAELEGRGRGAYTGALGYLNRDGDLDLNILIRTISRSGDLLRWRAGAGIVVDSVASRELDETRHKARGLLRALGLDA
ncbi:MAG: aminodeoxychorismate synthase component I [Rhodanobacteraceae bacterium]|nr:aminodeoxychorismate synthase component I [Rhodanobacteraceae bacterium]